VSVDAIADVTELDLLGKRNDGGVDMGIVAHAPIDGRDETLALIEEKVRNYLREAQDESFMEECDIQLVSQVRILFESDYEIDERALRLLSALSAEAAEIGIELVVRRGDLGSTPHIHAQ
jgi:hypothetical protein